ncbi:hypothetical protein ES703_71532 [subsurface metagenome]
MNVPDCVVEEFKKYESSYNSIGFIYNDDLYPADKWSSKRRSYLKKVVLREGDQKGKKYLSKYELATGFVREGKEVMAGRKWKGRLSESKDWKRYNYLTCGKYGMLEENVSGDKRYLVYKCNQRKLCPSCRDSYHKEKARKAEDFAAAVMRSVGVECLSKFRLTFPDFIRDQIKTKEQRSAFKALGNEFLQGVYGCVANKYGVYERGSVGVGIQCHVRSTQECHRDSFHLHSYVIPVIVGLRSRLIPVVVPMRNCVILIPMYYNEVCPWDKVFNEDDFERMRLKWAKLIKRLSNKLGFERVDEIPDEVDINYSYGYLPEAVQQGKGKGFNLAYDMRSPAYDLEKAAAAVNMADKKIIMSFKRGGLGYFANWSFEDYADQMAILLGYKNLNSTYGWLRRGEFYAAALGVEVKKEKDDFTPVPGLSIRTEYKREYKAEAVPGKKKIEIVEHLCVRSLKDANNPGPWIEIDLSQVHGEANWIESRKKRIYSVAKGKSPP